MFKCIDVGSWDFGTKTAEIIPVSSAGLTASDSNSFFIKRAGEHKFKEILGKMKLAKGEVPIHLIAMGATEIIGPNRNFDGFTRGMLKKSHHTFVTNAHVYQHHENKDPKKSYGKVAASLYNDDMDRVELLVTLNGSKEAAEKNGGLVAPDEDLKILAEGKDLPWSMGIKVSHDQCFIEGTLVATEHGYKPIEKIDRHDRVWSHTGELRKVNALYANYANNVGSVQIAGSPGFNGVTSNHPVLAITRTKFRCQTQTDNIDIRHTQFDGLVCGRCKKTVDIEPEWLPISDLQEGDFIIARKDKFSGRRYYAGEFGYMLGMYLGDGCITYSRKQAKNKINHREEKVGGISIACDNKYPAIIEKIKQVTSTISDAKVKCYKEGKNRDGVEKNGTSVQITDRELGLRLLKFGEEYCRYKRLHPEVFKWSEEEKLGVLAGLIDSDGCVDAETGMIRIVTINLGLMLDIQRLGWSIDLPITVSVNSSQYRGFNISDSTETSWACRLPMAYAQNIVESIKVNKWLAENEPISVSKSSGSLCFYKDYVLLPIKKAWKPLNSEKNLFRVYNFRVHEDESYIVNGLIVHNCSNCQHESKTPSEYCEEHECINKKGVQRFGCKEGLGKTAEDGFVQYVDNPSGTFIDISRVSTPADRTAYGSIAKYASYTLGGANLAMLRGYTETPEEKIIKQASIQVYSDVLIKLAQLESTLTKTVCQTQANFNALDELDPAIIKHAKYLTDKERKQELCHLADFNIILGPKQFAKFAGFKVTAGYQFAIKGLFGQLDQAVDSRVVILNECCKYAAVKKQSVPPYFNLYKQAQHYTNKGLQERLLETALTPKIKIASTVIKPTTNDYQAAVEYAIYKIAALVRMNKLENYLTAVIQNNV